METILNFILNDGLFFLNAATSIVGGAAMIAAVTPTKRDDRLVGQVAKVIDFIGFNFGHAKNLEESVKKTTKAGQARRRARIDAKKTK